jgi:hypothetical protein
MILADQVNFLCEPRCHGHHRRHQPPITFRNQKAEVTQLKTLTRGNRGFIGGILREAITPTGPSDHRQS